MDYLFYCGVARAQKRRKFKTYDGVNKLFNMAYEVLSWKIHRAMVNAKLEPYLGFLHSVQYGTPRLVCNLQERAQELLNLVCLVRSYLKVL